MVASQMGSGAVGDSAARAPVCYGEKDGMVAGGIEGMRHLPFGVMSEPQSAPLLLLV